MVWLHVISGFSPPLSDVVQHCLNCPTIIHWIGFAFSQVSHFHSLCGSTSTQVYKYHSLKLLCIIFGVPLPLTKLIPHHFTGPTAANSWLCVILCVHLTLTGVALPFRRYSTDTNWDGFVLCRVSTCHSGGSMSFQVLFCCFLGLLHVTPCVLLSLLVLLCIIIGVYSQFLV